MLPQTLNSHMGRIIAAIRRNLSRLDTRDRDILLAEFEWWYSQRKDNHTS